jgi:hypothetical protein
MARLAEERHHRFLSGSQIETLEVWIAGDKERGLVELDTAIVCVGPEYRTRK